MFTRLGLDATNLDNYGSELSQEDLDELTGYEQRVKELNTLHECWKIIGIIAGIVMFGAMIFGTFAYIKNRRKML